MQRTVIIVGIQFLFATTDLIYADDTVSGAARVPDTAAAATATIPSPPDSGDSLHPTDRNAESPDMAIRRPNRRDSLLDSIRSTIEDSGALPGAQPDQEGDDGHTGRVMEDLVLRVKNAIAPIAYFIRHNMLIAIALGAGTLLFLYAWIAAARRRAEKEERRFMTTTRLSIMDGEVQRACLYIEKHYMSTGLTPASVCGAIVTGPAFLETMFERELGMSVAAYIDQVRIHHARQILQWNSAADAAFVAAHVGYDSAAEFERHFARVTGTDFGSYRGEQQHTSGGRA